MKTTKISFNELASIIDFVLNDVFEKKNVEVKIDSIDDFIEWLDTQPENEGLMISIDEPEQDEEVS